MSTGGPSQVVKSTSPVFLDRTTATLSVKMQPALLNRRFQCKPELIPQGTNCSLYQQRVVLTLLASSRRGAHPFSLHFNWKPVVSSMGFPHREHADRPWAALVPAVLAVARRFIPITRRANGRITNLAGDVVQLIEAVLFATLAQLWWMVPVPVDSKRGATVGATDFIPLGVMSLFAGLAQLWRTIPVSVCSNRSATRGAVERHTTQPLSVPCRSCIYVAGSTNLHRPAFHHRSTRTIRCTSLP